MNAEVFSSPIFVRRSTVIVQEIAGLADAIDFLDEWPEDRRDLIHQTALRACFDAHDGHKPIGAAHNAFLGFAKRAGILEDPNSAMQWVVACKSGSGKVQV
ncbi:DUF982 domain-containing protein [Mesorhizobium abyssinicae]|uniref:DUF982 domain-containing protein n=1 Tax=Mesorhizobium captivum TaxID=3072319 RepID=A0ABU4Z7B3_9HYPH|nr:MULTISPECIES: DUF982 domain-containing protein [Mesorhizobium]MDX8437817.1 DUF982 domain-containing protein [Mesorhizobium abyssinicae]MDX8456791.1 DUF982 domain-containing protein [Mesorhizobium sp. VK9D]MDX8494195.1 DUF982 domain-containing protein [Mesorhizobium sp. VK22B]